MNNRAGTWKVLCKNRKKEKRKRSTIKEKNRKKMNEDKIDQDHNRSTGKEGILHQVAMILTDYDKKW